MGHHSEGIRLAASLPVGDETRRKILADLKVAGTPRVLYPAVTDLLISYGILQPHTNIDQQLVAKATEKFLVALQKAAMESDWAENGPGFDDGFVSTGKEGAGYAYLRGGEQIGGYRGGRPGYNGDDPPEYDDIEDADASFDSEWKSRPEALEIKNSVAAAEFLREMAALGYRVHSPKPQAFGETMLSHRRVMSVIAPNIAQFVAKKQDMQASLDYWSDQVMETVEADNGTNLHGDVKVKSVHFDYGKTVVTRDSIVVPIMTTVTVDVEDLRGDVDYETAWGRMASVRMLHKASTLPKGDETRRRILANLVKMQKSARGEPPALQEFMKALERVPGVRSVYVTDIWRDGYYHLRVVVEPKAGPNALGGYSGKTIDIKTRATSGYTTVYNLPDYPKVVAAVRALARRSGFSIEGIQGPQKLYEFQDAYDRARKEPRLSGYDGNEISIELYV